jgi:hypothetical protein
MPAMVAQLPSVAPRARRPRRTHRVVLTPAELSARSEAELIAHVLGGSEPVAELRRCGVEVARCGAGGGWEPPG